MRDNEVIANLKSRELLPSRFACHLPPGGRLLCDRYIGRDFIDTARQKIPLHETDDSIKIAAKEKIRKIVGTGFG
ncbi:MAG: hypothetical protein IJW46_03500 [Clostridia bacterium]|nr:hypothetical protein [Clostridia bacterium]